MADRFFVSTPIAGSGVVVLAADEARHLSTVLRASAGDEVTLFDGSGDEFIGRIQTIRKNSVDLQIVERRTVSRELPFTLTLAVALPKGERQKWLIEKAVELGVTRLLPLITQRGVAQPVEAALERLRRTVIEASKQCGRNRLMEIAAAQPAAELFASAEDAQQRMIAHPGGRPIGQCRHDSAAALLAAIGPEGGFSPDEVAAAASAGWQTVSLGDRILRVETAALAVAAWAATSHP